ncbi:MAG: UDP binding domain-containing protein, partial [Balneolaceae bacterium]
LAGVQMKAYDPEAIETFKASMDQKTLDQIQFVEDQDHALEGVDALIICTEWNEFRRPGLQKFSEKMKKPVIFDGRNLYDLKRAEEAGLTYFSIGRPSVTA